jgi:hypothetical protein
VEQVEEKEQSSKPEASHRHEDEVAAPRMEGESADFDADEAQQVQDLDGKVVRGRWGRSEAAGSISQAAASSGLLNKCDFTLINT